MNFKIKSRFLIFCVALGALGALTLSLSGCHYTAQQKADWVTSKISSKLDLTKEQKVKLDAVKQTFLEIRKAHEADEAKHIEEVKKQVLSDHLDPAKIKSLMAQRQKMVDENFDAVFSKVSDFHSSLSAEQKKKAVELIDKFASHMGQE